MRSRVFSWALCFVKPVRRIYMYRIYIYILYIYIYIVYIYIYIYIVYIYIVLLFVLLVSWFEGRSCMFACA